MGLVAATTAFCKLLFNRELSDSFQQLVDGKLQPRIAQASPEKAPAAKPIAKPEPKPAPTRSDAISLLAALQREARLLDLSLIHI